MKLSSQFVRFLEPWTPQEHLCRMRWAPRCTRPWVPMWVMDPWMEIGVESRLLDAPNHGRYMILHHFGWILLCHAGKQISWYGLLGVGEINDLCLSGLILFFPNVSIEVPKPLCPPREPTNQTFRAKQLPAIQLQIDFGNEILRFSDWFNPHPDPASKRPDNSSCSTWSSTLDQNTPANICLVVNLLACGGSQPLGSMC